MFRESAGRRET
uniref:Uncharacterized protein n=1 Tax=Anguilla anguilla TaxID=7936 RepID=A0A0E9QCW9_ANGAN